MTPASGAERAPRAELRSLLRAGLSGLVLQLADSRVESLLDFADLLLRWNRTYNLTAIRAPRDIVTHHLLDCLAIVPLLQRELARTGGRRVLDAGSGAGLPGIVIALADPKVDVVCVDSVGKKAAFISQAVATLQVANVQAIHGRVEALQVPGFDVITSRAFSSLSELIRVTEHLLNPGGVWMAMKGRVSEDEIGVVRGPWTVHVEPVRVPELDAERCIVNVKRAPEIICERTLPLDSARTLTSKFSS